MAQPGSMLKNQSFQNIHDGFRFAVLAKKEDDLTFDELSEIEATRTKLYKKAKDFDQFQISKSFVGTIIPYLLMSPLSWGMVALYVIIRVLLRKKIIFVGIDVPQINTTIVSIIGGFMSFFLVFFLSQAYTRFMAQYTISKNIVKCITRLSFIAKNSLPHQEALRLIRYANAAHIVGYVGLSDAYSLGNLFDPLNDKFVLLTEKEAERLRSIDMDVGGSALREVIGWIMNILYSNYQQSHSEEWKKDPTKPGPMDLNTFNILLNEVLTVNGSFSDLFSYAEQVFPFSYMHLLVLINAMYLVVITYTIATFIAVGDNVFPDLLGAFLLLCNLIFVTGMREIGGHMIDPYGNDVTDLSIISYIQGGVKSSMEIFHGKRVGSADMQEEMELLARRPSLRAAFSKNRTSVLESVPFLRRTSLLSNNSDLKERKAANSQASNFRMSMDDINPGSFSNIPSLSNFRPLSSAAKEAIIRSQDEVV